MIRLTRAQVLPIGLDLGSDSIKMLQLEVVDEQSLSVVAAARQVLPEETPSQPPEMRLAASMALLRHMLRTHPFRGREVVAALPREILQVKNLRLPPMPPAELDAAVQFEARNVFSLDADPAMVRYLPAGEVRQGGEGRIEVIAMAARESDVGAFVEQLHRCGCVIESLDFEPGAIYRGIERFIRRREDENEVHVLVDVGMRRTQVIVGKGHDISFFKPVEIGATHLQDAVARKLGITPLEARTLRRRLIESPAGGADATQAPGKTDPVRQAVYDSTRSTIEELAREIALCLRYCSVTFRGQRPTRVRLLGGEAADPQLLATLGAALPIPVEVGRPLSGVNTSAMKQTDRRGCMSEWAVAFGLGLKRTSGYFGSRDGKRRDTADAGVDAAARAEQAASSAGVEVVDLANALQSAAPAAAGEYPARNLPPSRPPRREPVNA